MIIFSLNNNYCYYYNISYLSYSVLTKNKKNEKENIHTEIASESITLLTTNTILECTPLFNKCIVTGIAAF